MLGTSPLKIASLSTETPNAGTSVLREMSSLLGVYPYDALPDCKGAEFCVVALWLGMAWLRKQFKVRRLHDAQVNV